MAAAGMAMVTAGRIRASNPPLPTAGSQPNRNEKMLSSRSPMAKLGIDTPSGGSDRRPLRSHGRLV